MMSRRMVVALSLNFLASSSSPTARDAFSSCRISSSSLRVARMMDPSKMSVMSQIFWNDAPWDQWKMTSIRLALKLSTYGSTSTSMPSSLLISAMKRAVRCRSPSGPERSFVSWICSLVLSTGTRQLTSATSWCLSKLLNTPLNMSSVVSSSSAVSIWPRCSAHNRLVSMVAGRLQSRALEGTGRPTKGLRAPHLARRAPFEQHRPMLIHMLQAA
mmetsp:Transcript_27289/g.68717  ORF Transcript_27289/g.68717 Transcript_27289/m.68717 type:complete len:215 (-) Transcript_27289:181-825(-)